MKLFGSDNSVLMDIGTISRDGSDLLIKGKAFGAMPINAKLRPEEVRVLLRQINFATWMFIVTLPFRRSASKRGGGK